MVSNLQTYPTIAAAAGSSSLSYMPLIVRRVASSRLVTTVYMKVYSNWPASPSCTPTCATTPSSTQVTPCGSKRPCWKFTHTQQPDGDGDKLEAEGWPDDPVPLGTVD